MLMTNLCLGVREFLTGESATAAPSTAATAARYISSSPSQAVAVVHCTVYKQLLSILFYCTYISANNRGSQCELVS